MQCEHGPRATLVWSVLSSDLFHLRVPYLPLNAVPQDVHMGCPGQRWPVGKVPIVVESTLKLNGNEADLVRCQSFFKFRWVSLGKVSRASALSAKFGSTSFLALI
jgi:hypothetical protein